MNASVTSSTIVDLRQSELMPEGDLSGLSKSTIERDPTFSDFLEEQNKVDETTIQGYYKKKFKFRVESVNDFVSKVRKTAMCDKFFHFNDLQFAGLS